MIPYCQHLFLLGQNRYQICHMVPFLCMQSDWGNSTTELLCVAVTVTVFRLWLLSIIMTCFTVHQRVGINIMINTNHRHLQARRGLVKIVVVVTNRARRGKFFTVIVLDICDWNSGVLKASILMKSCKTCIYLCLIYTGKFWYYDASYWNIFIYLFIKC